MSGCYLKLLPFGLLDAQAVQETRKLEPEKNRRFSKPEFEADNGDRELFDREVDWFCQFKSVQRPRCREWVEFSNRFVPFCEDWNGCWVAETAIFEWNLYLRLPEGEYEPVEYEQGWHFRMGYP